jgi:hypothetical protein
MGPRQETQRNLLRLTSLRQLYTCKFLKISYNSNSTLSGPNKLCSTIQKVASMTRITADHTPRPIQNFKEPSQRFKSSNTPKILTLYARLKRHWIVH